MTADVHRLTPAGPITEPQADVIALLRELLAEAERAEIKGIGFFLVDGGDSIGTAFARGCARENDMVAGAATLQARVMEIRLANREPVDEPPDPA